MILVRKFLLIALFGASCFSAGVTSVSAHELTEKQAEQVEKLKKSVPAAKEVLLRTDSTLKKLFDESAGYVIFPRVAKGGFIFGGAHGTGLVYAKGRLIGLASVTQATVGAQAGGQIYREAIFFESDEELKTFKEGRAEFSAQVTVIVAAEGSAAGARYSEGVLVVIDPIKGMMLEASVGGQKFTFTHID